MAGRSVGVADPFGASGAGRGSRPGPRVRAASVGGFVGIGVVVIWVGLRLIVPH